MDSDELWTTVDAQRTSLADLLAELTPEEWETALLVRRLAGARRGGAPRPWPRRRWPWRCRRCSGRGAASTGWCTTPPSPGPRHLRRNWSAAIRAMVGSRRRAPRGDGGGAAAGRAGARAGHRPPAGPGPAGAAGGRGDRRHPGLADGLAVLGPPPAARHLARGHRLGLAGGLRAAGVAAPPETCCCWSPVAGRCCPR